MIIGSLLICPRAYLPGFTGWLMIRQPFAVTTFDSFDYTFSIVQAPRPPAEFKLAAIAVQMLLAYSMECPVNPSFQQSKERLASVDVILAVHVFQYPVPYPSVPTGELPADAPIGFQIVGAEPCRFINVLIDSFAQRFACNISYRLDADITWALNQGYYRGLARPAPAFVLWVSVSRPAANVGFVNLDNALHLLSWLRCSHCPPDTVHEKQCRLVRDTTLSADLQGADTLLAGTSPPEGMTPNLERYPAVFHDRTDTDCKLLLAAMTTPQESLVPVVLRILHLLDVDAATTRAGGNIAPPLSFHELYGCCLIPARLWQIVQYLQFALTGFCVLSYHTTYTITTGIVCQV